MAEVHGRGIGLVLACQCRSRPEELERQQDKKQAEDERSHVSMRPFTWQRASVITVSYFTL